MLLLPPPAATTTETWAWLGKKATYLAASFAAPVQFQIMKWQSGRQLVV